MDQVPQFLLRPLHPCRRDEEEAPRIHGPKAKQKVRARLLQAIQPPGVVCARPSGYEREEEGPLHDWSLHQAAGVHGAQHRRDISRICQQCHDHGRRNSRPQGNQEEEGYGSSIR
jgi:hypothetical protein